LHHHSQQQIQAKPLDSYYLSLAIKMIFIHFVMLALASLGAATNLKALSKRQGDGAFIPGTDTVSACASTQVECNDYCLDLADGDVCCSGGCKSRSSEAIPHDGH
jgi:hypothetical protein